jgi:hypothetical protein
MKQNVRSQALSAEQTYDPPHNPNFRIGNDGSICRYAHIECNFVLKVFWGPLQGSKRGANDVALRDIHLRLARGTLSSHCCRRGHRCSASSPRPPSSTRLMHQDV